MILFKGFKKLSCKHYNRTEESVCGVIFWTCPDCGDDNYRDR